MAAEHVGDGGRDPAIGNVHDVDVGGRLEQFAGEVGDRAGAGRAEIDLAGIGAGIDDELGNAVHAERRMNNQHFGNAHHQREQCQVLLPIERHLRHHEGDGGERGGPGQANGGTVGRTLGGGIDAGQSAGAGARLDHDLLVKLGGERGRERAGEQIGRAARGKRHDQPDRPVGKLRPCGSRGPRRPSG